MNAKPGEGSLFEGSSPGERELRCGCYVEWFAGTWRIVSSTFTCPNKHNFYDALAPELVEQESADA